MANRRFEMYQYRQILSRMRLGESDRDLSRSGLAGGRRLPVYARLPRRARGLDPARAIPDEEEIAAVPVLSCHRQDKPAKSPRAFLGANAFVITKTDHLPHFDFSMEEALHSALSLNPALECMALSATTGEGFGAWSTHLHSLLA